ncbi:hypothetical protein DMUE_4255 [Dictyocoela muelleri]|nr:hypothetical protein DMUE_4255 [Dictyocoela muelleri]
MNIIKFIEGQINAEVCIYNGFIYNIYKVFSDKIRYRCRHRYCPSRICLNKEKNQVIQEIKHIHDAEMSCINHLLMKAEIKKKAINTLELFTDVFSAFLALTKTKPDYMIASHQRYRLYLKV